MASISYNQFFKPIKNDNFTLSDFTLDTIGNKTWQTNIAKSYARNDKSIWNVLSYISNLDCGGKLLDTIYDNIQHYIDNVSNVDLCKVKALQSLIKYFGINYAIFDYFDDIPIELYNLINILSINRYYLFDKDTGILNEGLKNAVYQIIKNDNPTVTDQSINNIRTNKINITGDYTKYIQNNHVGLYSKTYDNYGYSSDPKLKAIIEENNLQISSIIPAELLSDQISNTQIVRYYKNQLFYADKHTPAELSAYDYILNNDQVNQISSSWGTFQLISCDNITGYDVNLNETYVSQNKNSLLFKIHINPTSPFILQKYGFTANLDKYIYVLSTETDIYSLLQIGQHVQAYKSLIKDYGGLSGKYIYPEYHYDMLHTSVDDADALLSTYLLSIDFNALLGPNHGYNIDSESTPSRPGMLDLELESKLSNICFLNANATSENIQFYNNTNIDYNKYKSLLQDLYRQLMTDMLTMTYVSGDYIYKSIDTNSYKAVEENNAIKNYYNVPISFDEQTAVNNIEQNLSSYYDYSKTEQKVIDNEIVRRARANDINILESRYSYYREAKVKQYINYAESIYNTFYNKNYNVYDVNKNYFNIENSTYVSIIGIDDAGNKSIDFDKIDDVANILTEITLTICRTREKVKSLVEKNSIRGTYLLIVIYLIEYFNSVIKNNYSEISSDISLENIKLIEYIDNTDYFNIRNTGTHYTANENIILNNKYWESTPIGDINAQTVSAFYAKLMDVPEISNDAERFDIKDFLTDVFKSGSFSYYDYKNNPAYQSLIQEGQSTISTFNIQKTDRINVNHDELISVFNNYKYDTEDIDKSIYNTKNSIHASYQLHPYIYDFVEYLNIKYPIENLFHKYIPENYDQILSAKVDDYIGNLGQINNIWKYDVFDFSGYSSRYEINSNKSDYLTTSPYVDRDGAFIEEALNAYLDDYLTFANDVVQVDENGKYKNKYYQHLKLSFTERQMIQKKLLYWHDYIECIAKNIYHNYDIYSYANDIFGNSLILYKTYLQVNPTQEDKKNTLGTLWVRYKNHPIAFPAFDIGFDDSGLIYHIHINNSDQLISENAQYYNSDPHKLLKLFNDETKYVKGFYDFELDNSLQQLFLLYPSNEYTDILTYSNSNVAFGKLSKTLDIKTNSYSYSIEQNENFIDNVDNRNIRKTLFQKTWSDFIGFYKQNNRVILVFVNKYLDEHGNETLYQTSNYENTNNATTYVLNLDNVILDFKNFTYEYYEYDVDNLVYNVNDSDILLTNSNNIITLAYVGKNDDNAGKHFVTNYIEDHSINMSSYADISSSYTFKSKLSSDTCIVSAYEGMYVIYDRQYLSNNSTYNISNMTSANSYVMLETDIAGNTRVVPELSNLPYSLYDGSEMHGIAQYPNDVAADSNAYSNDNTFNAFKQYIVVIDLVYKNDQFTLDRDIQYYNLNSDITFLPNYPKEYGKMRLWYHQTLSSYDNYKIQMMGKGSPCYEDVLKKKKTDVEEFIEREESPSESNGIRWESYPLISSFNVQSTSTFPLSAVIPFNDVKDLSAVAIIDMPTSGKDYSDLSLPLNLDSNKTSHIFYLSSGNQLSVRIDDTIIDPTFNVAIFKKYQVPTNLTTNAFHVLSDVASIDDATDRNANSSASNRIVITKEDFVIDCHTSITESELASKAFIYNIYKGYGELDSAGWYHNRIILYSGILKDPNNYTDYYGTQLFADNIDTETTKIANQSKAKSVNVIYIDGVERLYVETDRRNVGTDQVDVDLSLHLIAEYPGYSFRRSLLSVEFLPVNYANYSEYEQYHFVQTKGVDGGIDTSRIELNASKSPYDYEELYEKDSDTQNPPLAIKYQNEYDISQISNDFPTLLASLHIDVSEDMLNSYSKDTITDIKTTDQFVVEIDDMPHENYTFDYAVCEVDAQNRPKIVDIETDHPRCEISTTTITFTPELERLSGFYAFNDNIRENGIKLFFNYNNNTANSFVNPFYKYSYAIIPTGEISTIGLFNQVNTVFDYNPEVTKKPDGKYETRISSYSVWYNIIFLDAYQIKNVSDDLPKYQINRIGLSDFLDQSGLRQELIDLQITSTFDSQNVMRHITSARIEVNEQYYIYPVNLDDNKIITFDNQVKTFYFKNPNDINYLSDYNDGHIKYTIDDIIKQRFDASIYENGMFNLDNVNQYTDYVNTNLVNIIRNNPGSINNRRTYDTLGYLSYYTGLYTPDYFYYAKFQDISTFVSCSVPAYIKPTFKYSIFEYELSAINRILAEESKITEAHGREEDPSYILTEDGNACLALEDEEITVTNDQSLYCADDSTDDISLYGNKFKFARDASIELNIRDCYNLYNNYNSESIALKTNFPFKSNSIQVLGANNGNEILHTTLSSTTINLVNNSVEISNVIGMHVTNMPQTDTTDSLSVILSSNVDGNIVSSYFKLTVSDSPFDKTNIHCGQGKFNLVDTKGKLDIAYDTDATYNCTISYDQLLNDVYHTYNIVPLTHVWSDVIDSEQFKTEYSEHFDSYFDEDHLIPFDNVIGIQTLNEYSFRISSLNVIGTTLPPIKLESYNYGYVDQQRGSLNLDVTNTYSAINVQTTLYNGEKPTVYNNPTYITLEAQDIIKLSSDVEYINKVDAYDINGNKMDIQTSTLLSDTILSYNVHNLKFWKYNPNVAYLAYQFVNSNFKLSANVNIYINDFTKLKLYHFKDDAYEMINEVQHLSVSYPTSIDSFATNISTYIERIEGKENRGTESKDYEYFKNFFTFEYTDQTSSTFDITLKHVYRSAANADPISIFLKNDETEYETCLKFFIERDTSTFGDNSVSIINPDPSDLSMYLENNMLTKQLSTNSVFSGYEIPSEYATKISVDIQ